MVVGVKESALLNKLFTLINISLLSFIIICGATKADFSNWNININVIHLLYYKISNLSILIYFTK
jgi:hypothetical protein